MAVSITDTMAYKRLIAAGNNAIWYGGTGVSASTMTKLTASDGDIDTSDQLVMFEAFQKAFVINGSKLKVADFVNTKLTHTALGTAHAKGDILTQATTNATMIVDFTDTAKTHTYGYVTSGTFNATNQVTGDGSGTAFTPTAVTSKPHWFDYTVYPDGSSGTMPNKAYLGCLYNGRVVLSGNPEEPNQWYMSRQFDPWDYAYLANDAQSPIRGGNATAGLLGDIIRALVPHKDSFLIFGCASTLSILMGDPAAGGIIRSLDETTGIFGAKSWCFDKNENFYFWGTNGIYKCKVPQAPVCITQISLPKLVSDEAANSSTHRITMQYDHLEMGIVICVTKLSDGTNSNYWLDLKVAEPTIDVCPIFPESYPEECGVYSLFFYPANNNTYKKLLVGCKDGYIRKFDGATKSDNIGGSSEAIDSYCVFGPMLLSDSPHREGKLKPLSIITGGSADGTTETDSDGVDYEIYTATTAAGVIDKIKAGSAPNYSGTIPAPGFRRGSKINQSARGMFAGIKLSNDTADEGWLFECMMANDKSAKRK